MKLWRRLPAGPALFICVAAVLLLVLASHEFLAEITLTDAALQPAFISLICAALVLAATGLAGTRLPAGPIAHWGAKLSYCLYLVHFPLISAALHWAGGSVTAFWAIYILLTAAVALLIHLAVERPFLRIKYRLSQPAPQKTALAAAE
jgi:peptidoglycan/LPS O-acetylase OafA/YrhL